jgi:hypothetical protein
MDELFTVMNQTVNHSGEINSVFLEYVEYSFRYHVTDFWFLKEGV